MRRNPFGWFGLAVALTLVLLHSGFDSTEGSEHLRVGIHWLQTGQLGQENPVNQIYVRAPDGLFYPAHELGNILWLLPAAIAGLAVESFSPALPGTTVPISHIVGSFFSTLTITLTALGFWKLLEWSYPFSARLRLVASTLLVFATMLLPYARALGDVGPTGCFVIWGAAFAVRASTTRERVAAAMAGLCFGAAVLTRIPSVVAVAPIFLWMVARQAPEHRWRMAAIAIAAALPCGLITLWFNDVRTGSPFVPALLLPRFTEVQPEAGGLAAGVAGLLASPAKSIFLFSPVLLLAVAGWPRMFREARADALMVVTVLVLFLTVHGALPHWHADWGWGPRYAVFVLPLLWLPAVFLLKDLRRGSAARRGAIALIAISLTVQAAALTINWQYQYQAMGVEGRFSSGMYWSADNQFTDALRGAVKNIARTAGAAVPATTVPNVSPLTTIASTGINVWWITAMRAGLSPLVVLPLVALLLLGAGTAWRRAFASVRG